MVFLHPFGDEEAEGLLRVAACEAVDAEMVASVVREGFNQQAVWFGEAGNLALQGEPMGSVGGQVWPGWGLEDLQDALGEQG